jgi:hypothetical protein
MEVSGQRHPPAVLPSGKKTGTHWIPSPDGPQSRSRRFGEAKILLLLLEFEPHIVQPATYSIHRSRYQDSLAQTKNNKTEEELYEERSKM